MDRNGQATPRVTVTSVALRKESVDRNVLVMSYAPFNIVSLSARRAWIEMPPGLAACVRCTVALRKESVDRNVASACAPSANGAVALRKESVDRNAAAGALSRPRAQSLSARRAWIEITATWRGSCPKLSLSARRAWIEMDMGLVARAQRMVALRKESVDRNAIGSGWMLQP